MKKIITIAILTIIPIVTFSQNTFGITGGISNSFFSDGILEQVPIDSKFSFYIGGVYEHELSNKIAFRPKLIFSMQGDRSNGLNFGTAEIDYKLSYLNMPLNFKFFSKPYVIVGPQIGLLINTKKGDFDLGDAKTFDYGFNIGFGMDLNDFFIECSAYQAISEVLIINDLKATNTVIQLGLGYHFK